MNRLHVYARLLRCRAEVWEIVAEAACQLAAEAIERGMEAEASSRIVASRASALHTEENQK